MPIPPPSLPPLFSPSSAIPCHLIIHYTVLQTTPFPIEVPCHIGVP